MILRGRSRGSGVCGRSGGLAGILAVALLLGCGERERPGVPPLHLLLITVESLRADHCSALGYPRDTTATPPVGGADPAAPGPLDFDALARTGVLFANAFAQAPEPRASIACLLTSRTPAETGVEGESGRLEPRIATLAELLASAGWRTAAFCAASAALEPLGFVRGFERFDEVAEGELATACDWAAERFAAGERAFLWLHLATPAPPFDSGALVDAYHDPAAGDEATEIDRYDAELARANALLRAWLERYRELPGAPLERTLVVVAGTNGVRLAAAERGLDSPLHDALLHVPLVLRHPQSLTGSRILSEVVELADVLPTVCDWLELPLPPGTRGRSLLPLVDTHGSRDFERRPARAAWGGFASARDERWRLILPRERATQLDGSASEAAWIEPGAPPARAMVDPTRVETAAALREALRTWLAPAESSDP